MEPIPRTVPMVESDIELITFGHDLERRMISEVEEVLSLLGLQHHLHRFLQNGFDDWETLSRITESDFAFLEIPRGHRRKLQRAIARRHLWPDLEPLPSPDSLHKYENKLIGEVLHLAALEHREDCSSDSSCTISLPPSACLAVFAAAPISLHHNRIECTNATLKESSRDIQEFLVGLIYGNPSPGYVERTLSVTSSIGPSENHEVFIEQLCNLDSRNECRRGSLSLAKAGMTDCDRIVNEHGVIDQARLEAYLEAYLQSNHVLYLSDESELRHSFLKLVNGEWLQQESTIELCLTLALGAGHCIGEACVRNRTQISEAWFAEALVRLSRFRQSIPKLPLMRILSLLSLYHLNSHPDVALKLLGAANGLETDNFPLSRLNHTDRYKWLRLWESLRFLQIVKEFKSFIGPWVISAVSDEDANSRLAQMHLYTLGGFISEIHKDQVGISRLSTALVLLHLQHLDRFRSNLPLYFCFEAVNASDMLNGLDDRQKASILHIHCLYLGIVSELLSPFLVDSFQTSSPHGTASDQYASRCVESAGDLINLCKSIYDSGYSLAASFVPLHYLFKAAVIMILDMVKEQSIRILDLQTHISAITTAKTLMETASTASLAVRQDLATISSVLASLGLLETLHVQCET
ncbi:hypothetical protein VTL71DRAFT_13448 [Oculimacula yallundae]|uniref:SAM domain-containing protein n=1 Tax=Oculimacula yallundae TaxID=86028 RepID=A0ABR4CKZ8_9HELO